MRKSAQAVGSRQVQVKQQQVDVRVLLHSVKQGSDRIGIDELAVRAGCRKGALERRAEQRVVIDDENFVAQTMPAALLIPDRLETTTLVESGAVGGAIATKVEYGRAHAET